MNLPSNSSLVLLCHLSSESRQNDSWPMLESSSLQFKPPSPTQSCKLLHNKNTSYHTFKLKSLIFTSVIAAS